MQAQHTPRFQIILVKPVTFRDLSGGTIRSYKPGDVMTSTHDAGPYFITPMGGIWKDEARKVY